MTKTNLHKIQVFGSFKGKDIFHTFGPNIDGFCFAMADMRETNWSGVKGKNVDLRCSDLTGANMPNLITPGWDCTGAKMVAVNLDGTEINAIMHGVVLADASLVNVKWNRGGHAAGRGVILPKRVDFSTWENGRGFHAAIAKVIEQGCDGDVGAQRACDYILGQSQRCYYEQTFPCWIGFVRMCQNELKQSSVNKICNAFEKYPKMRLMSMWNWAEREIKRSN